MIQFVSFKANYKTLKCYVIEMYFMQIFNKISLQLQNIYKVIEDTYTDKLYPV